MTIQVLTPDPEGLLEAVVAGIDAGDILTWTYDDDGDFVHQTPDEQWIGQAWLHPEIGLGMLVLQTVPPEGGVTTEAYAVYHGRFIEMLLAHFDEKFVSALATATE